MLFSLTQLFSIRQFCLLGDTWYSLEIFLVVTAQGMVLALWNRSQGCC